MRSLLVLLALSLGCALASPAVADGVEVRTRLLSDYLTQLNEGKQSIIFSSDLVSSEMRLPLTPPDEPTQAELQRMLQPFGLTVRSGPGGSWLIVSRPTVDEAPAARQEPAAIPEIIVSSSLHRLGYRGPATHTILDREIAARVPTTTDETLRLLQRLPGTASGGISTKSHVRGGEINETLYLFDGLRLYEPYHLKNFQSVASIIDANAIGAMDIYTGAYPAHYGDRMSGVVDISLRQPEKPLETELAFSFFNTSLLSTGTFGDMEQGEWLASARRGNLDLIADVIKPEIGNPDYQDYLAHVGWEFGSRARLSANFLHSQDKLRLVDAERGEEAVASYSNQIGWLKWSATWNDRLQSDSILALSDISNRRAGELDLAGIVSGSLDEQREFSVLQFRQDWDWLLSDTWMLRYGFKAAYLDAEYRFSSLQSVLPPFDAILDNQPSTVRNFDLASSGAQYAVYSELRWRPTDQWTFDIGLRWDQQNYTSATGDNQFSPRLGILYQPRQGSELRVGWGKYSQAQEINELQVSDGITEFFPAQQAEHLVINFRQQLATGVEASISAYRKSFRELQPRFENSFNTLTLLPELQFDRIRVDPSGAEAVGVELMLSRGLMADDVFWWLGYTWSKTDDRFPDGDIVRSWDQTHTLKGGLGWRWGVWDVSAAAELRTGWPRTAMTGELITDGGGAAELVLDVSARNADRHSLYHTLDLRISRDYKLTRGELTAFLEVTNLLDQSNDCCVEYSLAADGSLASRDGHWLPLVPSLGIVWRF